MAKNLIGGNTTTINESGDDISVELNSTYTNFIDVNETLNTTAQTLPEAINENKSRLDEISNYSSTEQLVGEWTGGEPLYRRVFSSTANFQTGTIAIGSLDDSYRVRFAMATFYNTSNQNEYIMSNPNTSILHNAGNISIQFTNNWGNGTIECIVYYTK